MKTEAGAKIGQAIDILREAYHYTDRLAKDIRKQKNPGLVDLLDILYVV